MHLNPRVRETAREILGDLDRVDLIEPLDVLDMHNLMERSFMIMTDSGGIQEEAPSLGKPVLVLRSETERPEAVEFGTVRLIGTEEEDIYKAGTLLIRDKEEYKKMETAVNPYGDGKASKRIVDFLLYSFGFEKSMEEFMK